MAPRRQGEHPTQAPQTTETEQPVENPGHIEQFDYRKTPITDVPEGKLLGGIPDSTSDELTEELKSPARFRENPILDTGTTAPDRKLSLKERYKQLPRSKKLLAMVAAGTAGVVVGVLPYAGTLMGGNKYVETEDGMLVPENVATAPAVPGETATGQEQYLDPATTDPEVFANQSYEMILSETVPVLEQRRAESIEKIDEFFESQGMPSIPTPDEIENPTPENKEAQKIQRNIAADVYTVTEIAMTNTDYAKNLTRAIFNNDVTYNYFVENDFNGKKHAQRLSVVAVSPELTQGTVGNFTVEEPSFVMLVTNMDGSVNGDPNTNPLVNSIVSRYDYGDGKSHYAETFQMQSDNPNFVDYPENIVPVK